MTSRRGNKGKGRRSGRKGREGTEEDYTAYILHNCDDSPDFTWINPPWIDAFGIATDARDIISHSVTKLYGNQT